LKENSISTVVTTQIDRVHLTPAETEAVYSPKHRTGRCLVLQRSENRPQGHRRLRFFFLLHLSKSTPAPPGADNEDPRTVQPALRRPNPRSPRQMAANPRPPSMNKGLLEPGRRVNTHFEEIPKYFRVIRRTPQSRQSKTAPGKQMSSKPNLPK